MSIMGFLKTTLGPTTFVRVSDIEPLPTYVLDGPGASPSVTYSGQVVIAVTGTAVQLPSNTTKNGVIIKSLSSNSALRQTTSVNSSLNITVSGSGNGYILEPGEAIGYIVSDSNQIYVNGQAGDIFSFIGS